MKIGKKARNRAKKLVQYALDKIGTDESSFTSWDRGIEVLEHFRFNRKVRSVSLDRSASLEQKLDLFRKVLESSLGTSVPDGFDTLVGGLILEDLWDAISVIREDVRKRFNDRIGKVDVSITSAEDLSDQEKQKITQTLSGPMGNLRIKARWNKDPDLMAGLLVQSGTHVWDGSLKGRLNQLKQELLDRA